MVSDDEDIDIEVPMSQSINNYSSAASAIEQESSTIIMDGGMFHLSFFHSYFKYNNIIIIEIKEQFILINSSYHHRFG